MSQDEGPATPIQSSGTYPIFRDGAIEAADKLEAIGTSDAALMAGEMRWYEETFGKWSPTNRPDNETRNRLIAEFFTVYRRALEYISKHSGKPIPSRFPLPLKK